VAILAYFGRDGLEEQRGGPPHSSYSRGNTAQVTLLRKDTTDRCLAAGVGSQFLATATGILLMAMLGMFNVHRHGSINTASILLYALTSCKLFLPFSPQFK